MLLFLNALKGLKKKKVQMGAIILMVMLSTGIYVAMNSSLDRLENRYYEYLDEQKVELFSFSPVINYKIDISSSDMDEIDKTYFVDVLDEERVLIDTYWECLDSCSEEIYGSIGQIFNKYGANDYIAKRKLDGIVSEYDFYYTKEVSKIIKDDKRLIKAIPYNSSKSINIPYLVEGAFPSNDDEITILPNYAKSNGIVLGDLYKIGNKTYKIVGYAYASDYIYPMISLNVPIFDEKNNNIVFLSENSYNEIVGLNDDTYVARFNYDVSYEDRMMAQLTADDNKEQPILKLFDEQKDVLAMDMNTVLRIVRTDYLQAEFNSNRTFADAFLYLLLSIAVFIILVITKKRIDDERLQIGVLKSLGYNSFGIATSYLVYPIIGSIIGGLLGYFIGISFNPMLTNLYLNYFTVPLNSFTFDLEYLYISIIIPLVSLSILSYLIALYMLRKKPLYLLKEGSNLKVNWFSKIVTKLTMLLPFKYRFKYSLASRSFGKLLIVSFTSFATGMLIVLTLIGMNLFNSMIDKTYEGLNFDYMVNYSIPLTDKIIEDDLIMESKYDIVGVIDNNGNRVKEDDEDSNSITLTGIDEVNHYLEILDSKGDDITKLVKDGIIINQSVASIYDIDIGDEIVMKINEVDVNYKVVGISEEYIGMIAYVHREDLCNKLGMPLSYTKKYSNNSKYDSMSNIDEQELSTVLSIFNLNDLKENVGKQMQMANSSIYIVIGFAGFMALVIIAVIANIVVEENKKTISLMKVMGYRNKEISGIVLNIYTPFVVVFYLLSIPAMVALLKKIVDLLVGDINMAIPISLSPGMALVGLFSLLLGYYIAIGISKKVLNKVPLAIALKRE